MVALLVVVTLISLGAALGLLVWVLRLAREERERSEARAAALALLLDGELTDGAATESAEREPPEGPPIRSLPAETPRDMPPVNGLTDRPLALGGISGGSPPPALLLAAAVGVFIVGVVLAILALTGPDEGAMQTQAAVAPPAPLELLALRHQRRDDVLEISGLVRNPPSGRAVVGLEAVADSFAADGAPLTRGRKPLATRRLDPGEESPFAILLSPAASVKRYRISFVDGTGTVPHVDLRGRRAESSAAAPNRTGQAGERNGS